MSKLGSSIQKCDAEIAGMPACWLQGESDGTPTLYLHGNPDTGAVWLPFLHAAGGIAPDLPGWGETGRPAHFAYDIGGYADWLAAFTDHLGLERFNLVVHDWGAVGLALAQREPERIARLVIIDAVPFLPGYRWHWLARRWRLPVIGELTMGFGSMPLLGRALGRRTGVPQEPLERFLALDHASQRAVLRLYRSAAPDVLAAAGARLGAIAAPALVVWGDRDPYIPSRLAHAYAAALGGAAEVEVLTDTGHWPWLERPEVVDRVVAFLTA